MLTEEEKGVRIITQRIDAHKDRDMGKNRYWFSKQATLSGVRNLKHFLRLKKKSKSNWKWLNILIKVLGRLIVYDIDVTWKS